MKIAEKARFINFIWNGHSCKDPLYSQCLTYIFVPFTPVLKPTPNSWLHCEDIRCILTVFVNCLGTTDNGYAVYALYHMKNRKKTLTSPTITAGRYCLGFWYYKTGSSSILTVNLISTNTTSQLWNANNAPLKAWTYTTVDVSSDKQFQVSFLLSSV